MDIKAIFAIVTILFPIVMAVTAWIKSEFNTTGKTTKIASYIISLIASVGYGTLIAPMIWWQIIVLYIMVVVASNGGYVLIQNLLKK